MRGRAGVGLRARENRTGWGGAGEAGVMLCLCLPLSAFVGLPKQGLVLLGASVSLPAHEGSTPWSTMG